MKKFKKLLVPLLALAVLSGCGGTDGNEDNNTDDNNDDVVVTTKDLSVAVITDIQSMDIDVATDGTSFIAMQNCMQGLTEIDADGLVIPEVALSWDISDDATVYTFHLDPNAVWSNGDQVTANDFVYSWQRLASPEMAATYNFMLPTVGVANARAVIDGGDPDTLGIKAINDTTLEVTLDKPCDFFLNVCAFPVFFPLNEKFVEAQGDQYALTVDNLLFNGPFVMTEWIPGNSFAFAKNEDYVNKDDVNLDTLSYKLLKDTQSAILAYNNGEVDMVTLSGNLVDAYKNSSDFQERLSGYLWYLSLNFKNEYIQNKNLRLAIAYAIDRDAICNSVLKDGSVAAEGIIPIGLATSPDGKDYRSEADTYFGYDLDLAQDYMDKAKAELGVDNIELEFLYEDTEQMKNVSEFVKSELDKLDGLTVNLKSQTKKARLQLMTDGDYEIGLTRWGPDYADPQTYLEMFITKDKGGTNNPGNYSNDEYDELLLDAFYGETAGNSEARWQKMVEAEDVLMNDAGVIPMFQIGGAMLIRSNVSGIEFHAVGVDCYERADID